MRYMAAATITTKYTPMSETPRKACGVDCDAVQISSMIMADSLH